MILDAESFAALVAQANLAPSVHNTQPTRWRLETDGSVSVLEAVGRRLPAGDPLGRDADVSHGAAIEGFSLAASVRGWTVSVDPPPRPADPGLRPVARLTLGADGAPDPLQAHVDARRSYRGAFSAAAAIPDLSPLTAQGDARLATTREEVGWLAALNDRAGLATYRDRAFRAELVSWMRLSRRDPRWALDGLNVEALAMSRVEAAGAGVVLRPGVFEALDRVRLAAALVGEAKVVKTAQAIVLFHRPQDEPPLLTGRRFYRLWLEITRLGLCAAPMSVLADDSSARSLIAEAFALDAGRRLITTFRVGAGPVAAPARARLPTAELCA